MATGHGYFGQAPYQLLYPELMSRVKDAEKPGDSESGHVWCLS